MNPPADGSGSSDRSMRVLHICVAALPINFAGYIHHLKYRYQCTTYTPRSSLQEKRHFVFERRHHIGPFNRGPTRHGATAVRFCVLSTGTGSVYVGMYNTLAGADMYLALATGQGEKKGIRQTTVQPLLLDLPPHFTSLSLSSSHSPHSIFSSLLFSSHTLSHSSHCIESHLRYPICCALALYHTIP